MLEAARIAWAAILIKTRQLILFDGAGFGTFEFARSGANGPEWTHEGPQMGHSLEANLGYFRCRNQRRLAWLARAVCLRLDPALVPI